MQPRDCPLMVVHVDWHELGAAIRACLISSATEKNAAATLAPVAAVDDESPREKATKRRRLCACQLDQRTTAGEFNTIRQRH